MKRFQDLLVWQKAHQCVLDIYRATERFPAEEKYGLTSQMRRASISVSANIVEGHKRRSRREFAHFMLIAESSLEEVKYYLELSRDLGYLLQEHMELLHENAEEVGRMLYGLKLHLKQELNNAKASTL